MADSSLAEVLTNSSGDTIGYSCRKLVEDNKVSLVDHTFFVDVVYPESSATIGEAVEFLRSSLIRSVAEGYGISNGVRCANPPVDGSSWLVQVSSDPSQYSQVVDEVWKDCRKRQPDDGEACVVIEGTLSSSVLGSDEAPDAEEFIQALLDGPSLTGNSPFEVSFVGRPQADPNGQGELGQNALDPPIMPSDVTSSSDANSKETRKTVTIIGGLLVAAFVLAFIGIVYVIFRRRRAYLQEREAHSSLLKSPIGNFHKAGTESQSQDGNPKSLSQPSPSEDYAEPADELDDGTDPENFPNNITFDLGNSFKDQLMGVHARSTRSKTTTMPQLGSGSMPDNTSDSDADSWAQTDGTIGSLELQLEPITAEV